MLHRLDRGNAAGFEPEEGPEVAQGQRLDRRGGGKHQVKMTKRGCRPITLPADKRPDYPTGLTVAVPKQAGLKDL